MLGGWNAPGLAKLEIRSAPLIYLIGPDDTVLAKKANPEQLRPLLARALGEK